MQYSPDIIDEYMKKHSAYLLAKQLELVANIKLSDLINNINPYFFPYQFKNVGEIIKELVNVYISSIEETIFGDWLEGLAIFVNQKVFGGRKSGVKGIDLEFDNNGIRYIVSIKSGPNWGNSSQVEKMKSDFNTAMKTLRTSNSNLQIVCVNGCCYGKDENPDKGSYFKYCGQRFWEFIGGNETIYIDIIEPLGYMAKERNDYFLEKYSGMLNRFSKEFMEYFCDTDGNILWKKLTAFNSGKDVSLIL